jgi:hypothetical protein
MGATLLSLLFILSYVLVACGGGTAQSQKTTVLTVGSLPWNSQNFNPFYGITGNVNPGTTGMIYETLLYMNILKGGMK